MSISEKSVYSSHVNTIAYDDEAGELLVTWDTGRTSIYSGVTEHQFHAASSAWSVGKYLHENIKPFHDHRYAEQS